MAGQFTEPLRGNRQGMPCGHLDIATRDMPRLYKGPYEEIAAHKAWFSFIDTRQPCLVFCDCTRTQRCHDVLLPLLSPVHIEPHRLHLQGYP